MSKVTELLLRYEKKDIVEAIEKYDYPGDYILRRALRYLEEKRLLKLQEQVDKASQEAIEAVRVYSAWWKACVEKYGDGEKVDISKIPQAEWNRGIQLENNSKTKYRESNKAHKCLNDFFNNLYHGDDAG